MVLTLCELFQFPDNVATFVYSNLSCRSVGSILWMKYMNKIGIGVVAVCSCLVLVILVMSRQEEEVVAAEFFPENVLFYGEQHDFSEKYYTFRRSRRGKPLPACNMKKPQPRWVFRQKKLKKWKTVAGR